MGTTVVIAVDAHGPKPTADKVEKGNKVKWVDLNQIMHMWKVQLHTIHAIIYQRHKLKANTQSTQTP